MAPFKILLALSLFLSLTFMVNGTWVVTKRTNKIIVGERSGSFMYLREVLYDPETYYPDLDWKLYSDPRFPNGVFIEALYPEVVWDIKGNNAVTGAAVIVYPKKQTQLDSRNQRWVRTSDGQYASILNPVMVITVNATGYLVMGVKNSSNPLQQFYPAELSYIEARNNKKSEVYVSSTTTDFGWGLFQTIPAYDPEYEWMSYYVGAFINSIVTFKDGAGNVLPPSPVNFTGQELFLTFNDVKNVIPVGTHLFKGTLDGTLYTEMTITITKTGTFSGSGKDGTGATAKPFKVSGYCTGYQLPSFTKKYGTDPNSYSYSIWDGAVSYNPFTLSGTLFRDQTTFVGTFNYVKQ